MEKINIDKLLLLHSIEVNGTRIITLSSAKIVCKEICNQAIDLCAENADLYYYDSESDVPEGEISTGDSEYGYYSISKKSILNTKKQIE